MATNDTNQQTVQAISELLTAKLPFPGKWYYPSAGINQLVYPDFQPADGTSNSIYYPSYQLANLYAAYSDSNGLAFSATKGTDPIQSYNFAELQTTGLDNILRGAFGSITWGLSPSDRDALVKASVAVDQALQNVLADVKDAYSSNPVFNKVQFSGSAGQALATKLQALAYIIANNADDILLPGTAVYDKYKELKTQDSWAVTFQKFLSSALASGSISNWSATFDSGYGPIDPATGEHSYLIPWNEELYNQYRIAISSPEYTTWKNITSLQLSNSASLVFAEQYLTDLEAYNRGQEIGTTSTSSYMSTVPGFPGASKYTPKYSVSPLAERGTGNSIDFTIFSESYNSASASADSSQSITWNGDADADGWWWSASASNSGSDLKKTSWGQFDSSARNLTGTFSWKNINQRTIQPSSDWYNGDALSQAWSAKLTANNPNFKGGYAFSSPDLAYQYIRASLYYPSGFAYGEPSSVLELSTDNISQYSSDSFHAFEQTTTAQAGFGWGPFSIGGSTSWSTSDQETNSQYSFSASGNKATITNVPLQGVGASAGAGSPGAILGVQFTQIGEAQATMLDPQNNSTSLRSAVQSISIKKRNTVTYSHPEKKSSRKEKYVLGRGDDIHYGAEFPDWVAGGKGDDVIAGLGGNDYLFGENGDDVIYGGFGRDKVWGGKGRDYVVLERNHVESKSHVKLMDWTAKDEISLDGYIPSDVEIRNNQLWLDGIKAATFKGLTTSALTSLIDDAHYSMI